MTHLPLQVGCQPDAGRTRMSAMWGTLALGETRPPPCMGTLSLTWARDAAARVGVLAFVTGLFVVGSRAGRARGEHRARGLLT